MKTYPFENLSKEKTRLNTAGNMMLDGILDAAEFKEIKNQYEEKIEKSTSIFEQCTC